MIVYRISYFDESGAHLGYRFVGSRSEVRYLAPPCDNTRSYEAISVTSGKDGILDLLNRLASHPDNG